jgi:high affinity Mn2+ porin
MHQCHREIVPPHAAQLLLASLMAWVAVCHATEATPSQDEAAMERDELEQSAAGQGPGLAKEIGPMRLEAHGQATYIRQYKPPFPADYSGPKSLRPQREYSRSFTGTLFLGARIGDTTEIYYNPETASGVPFSNLQGLGGFPNAELARTSGPNLAFYTARAFLRQTFNLSGEMEAEQSEQNQVQTRYAAERIVLTAGTISVLDLFDAVDYSRDPRTQFMNWASITYGAWDFPGDARGYTSGVAFEYITSRYAVRAGRFLVPKESNGLALDTRIFTFYGDVAELDVPYLWGERNGVFRLLGFRNHQNMGNYNEAIALGLATGTIPSVAAVRRPQTKYGFGVGVQQEVIPRVGTYFRLGWNNGLTETYAFTEIDRSFSTGVLVNGGLWGRERDSVGTAVYLNGLSGPHRLYLALGGEGFFLGDGKLNYGTESIVEAYYSWNLVPRLWVSFNYQHVWNPGYNRDRGPVDFFGIRLHTDF